MSKAAVLALASALAAAGPSLATPTAGGSCQAPPVHAACAAAAPGAGQAFGGPVLDVVDDHTVCVALGPLPSQWVRVELADARGGGTRGALMAAAFARDVKCVSVSAGAGGAARAVCLSDGVSISLLAMRPELRMQAAAWR